MATSTSERRYLSNDALAAAMRETVKTTCAGASRVVRLGSSTRGVDVLAMYVGRGAGYASTTTKEEEEDERDDAMTRDGRLRFGLVGNMHGDEPLGREIALGVAKWVCERGLLGLGTTDRASTSGYSSEEVGLAKRILDEVTLIVIPTVNPDGFAAKKRENANNVDLNRNFPYTEFVVPSGKYRRSHALGGKIGDNSKAEIETELIMRWSERWRMHAALNYHEGALVANYPWDGNADGSTAYSASPDDETFKYLARTYANAHPLMSKSKEFAGGITNGAGWYPLWGGLQDWHYVQTGTYSLTIEVDDEKWPNEKEIDRITNEHVTSSLEAMRRALFGSVRGFVRDAGGRGVAGAEVRVGKGLPTRTDDAGFFAKPLAPTSYPVHVSINPPAGSALPSATRIVPAVGAMDGAVLDVVLTTSEQRQISPPTRYILIIVILASIIHLRLVWKRRCRLASLSESVKNIPDVEKAVTQRRGARPKTPLFL